MKADVKCKSLLQSYNDITSDNSSHGSLLHRPNLVISGVGDSGTRGVKNLLEALGVTFCRKHSNKAGDNKLTQTTHGCIPRLLKSADEKQ